MHCKNCKYQIPSKLEYCPKCGERIIHKAETRNRTIRRREGSRRGELTSPPVTVGKRKNMKVSSNNEHINKKATMRILIEISVVAIISIVIFGIYCFNSHHHPIDLGIQNHQDKTENINTSEGEVVKIRSGIDNLVQELFELPDKQKKAQDNKIGARIENSIIEHGSYRIIDRTDNTVTLEITAPNMKTLLEGYNIDGYTGNDPVQYEAAIDDMSYYLLNALESESFDTIVNTVTVKYTDSGIVQTYELVDAMYGGLLTEYDYYIQKYMEELQ